MKNLLQCQISNKKCRGQALLHHAQDWAWHTSPAYFTLMLLLYLYKFPEKKKKSKGSGNTHCNINNTSTPSLLHLARSPLHIFYSAGTPMVPVGALMWTGEGRDTSATITEQRTWHLLRNQACLVATVCRREIATTWGYGEFSCWHFAGWTSGGCGNSRALSCRCSSRLVWGVSVTRLSLWLSCWNTLRCLQSPNQLLTPLTVRMCKLPVKGLVSHSPEAGAAVTSWQHCWAHRKIS